KLFTAKFINGVPTVIINSIVPINSQYIKIIRNTNNWTISYSTDGTTWVTMPTFTHTLTANKAGVFAGNAGLNPQHTAIIDYFFNNQQRIEPEDTNSYAFNLTTNIIGQGNIEIAPNKAAYTCNEQITLTAIPNLGNTFTEWTGSITGNINPTTLIMDTDKTITATFNQSIIITSSDLTSDDFNSCSLNNIWTFIDPVGDGSYSINGTNLLISVPSGTNHDVWKAGNKAPRIMQNINNTDFEIEAKFESTLTAQYQMQGIIIEQDTNNFIRADFNSDGQTVRMFIATFMNNTPTIRFSGLVNESYLRINRTADNWMIYSSGNGIDWTLRTDFNHTITTNKAGVFAGNAGLNPQHTAIIDYFFNNQQRIEPEDTNSYAYDLTTNIIGQGSIEVVPNKAAYTCNEQITLTAIPETNYSFSEWTGDITGSTNPTNMTMDSNKTITATFNQSSNPVIIIEPDISIKSDDFNSCSLNNIWTFIDPVGDGSYSINGTNLLISVPSGTNHDVWKAGNKAPRIMQNINNTDFEIEAKFESQVTDPNQIQGIIIEQDTDNYIRIDYYSNGINTKLFTAKFINNIPTIISNIIVPSNSQYLKINRTGNNWLVQYSTDGIDWTTRPLFTHSMTTNKVGVFAGNAVLNPAHTASIDYFFNNQNRIDPEDTNSVPTFILTTNTVGEGTIEVTPDKALYSCNEQIILTANPSEGFSLTNWSTGSKVNPLIFNIADNTDITAYFGLSNTNISVWYGDNQSFGDIGTPQIWVNILGNVNDPSSIISLKYKLNGNPLKDLSIGPDLRRLGAEGDFNIDLNISELNNGLNTIIIYATNGNNETTTKTVSLNYNNANVWPDSYTVDWSNVNNILDVAQPVDGKWEITGSGIKILEPSYDRLLAIGDVSWTDYEVTVPITIEGLHTEGFSLPQSGNGAGIGVLMRWNGHTDDPHPGYQPKAGYKPLGAIGWWWWTTPTTANIQIYRNDGSLITNIPSTPQYNITYMLKMRVETQGSDAIYRIKTWKANETEPGWLASGTSVNDVGHGSFMLLAHHVYATFGNVTVTPITNPSIMTLSSESVKGSKSSGIMALSVENVVPNSNYHSIVN
ncbi:TPA: DUF1349 domain-containing protein, partial [Candidatus Woesearchaeota archaeon]|nr:DUF1349 domain-containing protein [Candidatus Woesearchaeota archaeon]